VAACRAAAWAALAETAAAGITTGIGAAPEEAGATDSVITCHARAAPADSDVASAVTIANVLRSRIACSSHLDNGLQHSAWTVLQVKAIPQIETGWDC
jgi:hypothetical protein